MFPYVTIGSDLPFTAELSTVTLITFSLVLPVVGCSGNKEAKETLVLTHGMSAWSYLYRRMIPPLINAGYRLITNSGENGGQEVPHFHIHILAGEKIGSLR